MQAVVTWMLTFCLSGCNDMDVGSGNMDVKLLLLRMQ